jgi:signal transduction histidine kinase/CHASE2 domain-containing sensor protein
MNLLKKIKSLHIESYWLRIGRPPSYSVLKTLLILLLICLALHYSNALYVFDNIWLKHQSLAAQKVANDKIILIKIKPDQFKRWQPDDYQKIFSKLASLSPQAVLIDLPVSPKIQLPLGKIPHLYLSPAQIAQANEEKLNDKNDQKNEKSGVGDNEELPISKLFNYVGVLNSNKDNDGITRHFNVYPNRNIDLPYLPFLLWQQQTLSAAMPNIFSLQAGLDDDFNEHLLKRNGVIQSFAEDIYQIIENEVAWKNNLFFFTPASTDFVELNVLGLFGDNSLNEIAQRRYILIGLDDSREATEQESFADSLARKNSLNNTHAINFEDYMDRHLLINQKNVPSIELHAHILHALLEKQANWVIPPFWQIIIAILFATITILAVYRFNPKKMIWCIALSIVLFIGLQSLLFFRFQHWLAPSLTLCLLILIYPLYIEQRMRIFYNFMNHEIRRLKNNTQLSDIFAIRDLKSNQSEASEKIETGDAFEQHLNFFRSNISKLEDLQRFVQDNLNALPDAIMVVDLRGIIKLMNSPAKSWWQSLHPKISSYYFFHDLLNLEKEKVLESDADINWLGLEKKCMDQHKETQDLRFKITHNNHTQYILLKITPSFNRHLQVISYLCIFHDYTSIELAEQKRDETMRFLSHDMRSPQSSIIATLQMQKKQLPIPAEDQPEFLNKIEHYAQKTLHLAEEFIQMSKAEGKNYHFEEINLYEILIAVIDDVWPLAQKKHISIHQKLIEDAYVLADGELMARAITNILTNAIKYSFEHRNIWVELNQTQDKLTNQMMVMCTITDEGPGISPENQKKLFARYERFTNRQSTAGVGLGLFFVKTVLDGHQGKVTCQSKEGRGTAFKIYLPYLPENS